MKAKIKVKEIEVEWYHLLPLMFILAVVPLIVYLKVVPLTGASYDFWSGTKENPDFFSYYKGVWLIIAALASFGIFLLKLFESEFKLFKKDLYLYYGAAVVYLLLVIASTIFSKYPDIATGGFPDRYEGVYILISYIAIFFLTANLVRNEDHIKIMTGAMLTGAILIGTIGIFQYFGYDLWKSDFGKSLMLPSKYQQFADKLNFQFAKHTIYATLYHTDYVGSYMAMLFPFSFSLFVLLKNKGLKIFMGLTTLLMAINWLGCNSRAGMVGGALAFVVYLISINKFIIKYWKYFTAGLAIALLIFVGLNQVSHGYLGSRVNSLITDAKSLAGPDENKKTDATASIPLRDISIKGNTATVTTNTEKLSFIFNNDQITFEDKEGQPISSSYDNKSGKIVLNNPVYKDYNLAAGKMDDKFVLKMDKGNIKLLFNLKQGEISLIDNKGKAVDLKPVESWGFVGHEKLGSSRGYIWSRSIPLLKNTLLIGYGPDTFATVFPQNDIMGKMYAYDGDMWQIVDKPHDLYLQIALNTGILSLLAVLTLFSLYLIKSIRIYFRNDYQDVLSCVGVSVFVAIVGYLGAAFFNDSLVSVAPVFWVLLGLGVSINHMISQKTA